MLVNLSKEPSIANYFIAELRDNVIQKDKMRFRRNLERLGEVIAYKISKTFEYAKKEVETPLGIAEVDVPQNQVVLATILRAGIPLHAGFMNYFDRAENAFVSAYRKHHKDGTFEINLEYISCPPLEGKTLIIADPLLATGASLVVSVKELLENGQPESIHVATAIAASPGIQHVQRNIPNVNIWTGAIDEELTAKSYIVPGLGDAGDLAFGEKLQD
ncbi:MAG: uracil phosphoribosyltransferase [Bacteroidota bacterium]